MNTLDKDGQPITVLDGFVGSGDKQLLLSDYGGASVLATGCRGEVWYWLTADGRYDQGQPASVQELRERVAAVQVALESAGLLLGPKTGLALAVIAYGYCHNENFNADDFHRTVKGLSPYLMTDEETGVGSGFSPAGILKECTPPNDYLDIPKRSVAEVEEENA